MGQSSASKLEERYFLQKVKLGEGAFGVVWRAVDRHTKCTVAIKQMDKEAVRRKGAKREDIEREISVLNLFQHESITRLYGTYEDARYFYMALEYCDGGDFGDKVRERGMDLTENEARDWMRQVLSAVRALHSQRICHRDIKPDNFMVAQENLKLSDFGLAIHLPRGQVLVDKCGSPAFMAPELHNLPSKSRSYGLPVDLWATGVLMYMVLTGGRHPFIGQGSRLDMQGLLKGQLDFTKEPAGFFASFRKAQIDDRFSEKARQLCIFLVRPTITERLTADGALRHAWFESSATSEVASEAALLTMRSGSQKHKDARSIANARGSAEAASSGAAQRRPSTTAETMHLRGAAGQRLCNEALSEGVSPDKKESETSRDKIIDTEAIGVTVLDRVLDAKNVDRVLDGLTAARTGVVGAVASAPRQLSDAFERTGISDVFDRAGVVDGLTAARTGVADAVASAPRTFSDAFGEVKAAVLTPNPFVGTQTASTSGPRSESIESQLLAMGFTSQEITDALTRHSTVNDAASYILDHRAELLTELVTMGFNSSHAAEAVKHCTTIDAAIEWICQQVGGDPRSLQRQDEQPRSTL